MDGGIDLEDADVVEYVPADDLRRRAVAVLELDVDAIGAVHRGALARVRDHVRVGEDVAVARDDEARALRNLGRSRVSPVLGENRHHARGAARVDAPRIEAVAGQWLRRRPY